MTLMGLSSFFSGFSTRDYIFFHEDLLLIFILIGGTIVVFFHQTGKRALINSLLLLIYVLVNIFLWGSRASNIGTDTYNYYQFFFYPSQRFVGFSSVYELFYLEPLFKVLVFFTSRFQSYSVLLFTVTIIINLSLYVFVRKVTWNDKYGSSLILFLTIASMFSFSSIQFNIIRNGISIGFFLIGLSFLFDKHWGKFIFFSTIAFLFHHSILMPVLIASVVMIKRIPLWAYLAFFFVTAALSLGGYGIHSVAFWQDLGLDRLAVYTSLTETSYRIGFRWDFFFYNTFFLLVFFLLRREGSQVYLGLFKYFILTSGLFFLSFHIPFSDRIGVYSWIAVPILLFIGASICFREYRIVATSITLLCFYAINRVLLIFMHM